MLLSLHNEKEKIAWTNHVKEKMKYYRLSEKRVLNILRRPGRKEEGIADGTIAAMQPTGTKKNPTEVWMMYQAVSKTIRGQKFKKLKIISAWRYPGITPLGERPILPDDTALELKGILEGE
jgi:hypothetical protein